MSSARSHTYTFICVIYDVCNAQMHKCAIFKDRALPAPTEHQKRKLHVNQLRAINSFLTVREGTQHFAATKRCECVPVYVCMCV